MNKKQLIQLLNLVVEHNLAGEAIELLFNAADDAETRVKVLATLMTGIGQEERASFLDAANYAQSETDIAIANSELDDDDCDTCEHVNDCADAYYT